MNTKNHTTSRQAAHEEMAETLIWIKEVVSDRKGTAMWAQMVEDKARKALKAYYKAKGGAQ